MLMHDYLLTNVYKKKKMRKACSCCFKRPIIPILVQAMRYFKEADRHFLQNALARIGAYGGVEDYVVNNLVFPNKKSAC